MYRSRVERSRRPNVVHRTPELSEEVQRTFQDSGAPEGAEVHRSGTRPYDNAPMVSMSMSAWGRRAVVAVGVLALTLTAAVLPAGANPRGDCPLGRICLYD